MDRKLEFSYSYDVNSNADYIIYANANFYNSIIKYLVKFIDICQLPLLTFNLDVKHKTNIFIKGCYTGKIITSISQLENYIIANGLQLNNLINQTVININLNEIDLDEITKIYN